MIDQTAAPMRRNLRRGQHLLALFALLLLALAGRAHAGCQYTNNPGTVTFAPPSTITLPNSLPVGTILWTSPQIATANPPTLYCEDSTTNNGIANTWGNPAGSDETLFPTNVSGLSYRILHPDTSNLLSAYPYNASVPAGQITFSVASALQLVVTGTITPGSVLTGKVAQWNVDMCNGNYSNWYGFYCTQSKGTHPVEIFNTSAVRFAAPACTIAVDPTVVTLPSVLASAFTGKGTTTGQTPFMVQLNCQAGASLSITLATANQQTGTTSVIAPTVGNGYANNVGVQLLNGQGSPITFGSAISEGTTTSGIMNLPFYARYYQTGSGATAGTVTATATYTLTYQ